MDNDKKLPDSTNDENASNPNAVVSARHVPARGMVEVGWPSSSALFPSVWLRDSCPCPSCWHPVSKARILQMQQIQMDLEPKDIKVSADSVAITWSDGHSSVYGSEWLLERQFTASAVKARIKALTIRPTLWGSDHMQDNIPSITFDELVKDDAVRLRWHVALEEVGLCLVTGAPDTGALQQIADKVAFLRTTNYGTEFIVQSKVDPSSLAYTAVTLGFHTDLSFYDYVPGVQMLHCVLQTPMEGGDNVFADGFHVARQMSVECPDHYRVLTETPVDRVNVGKETYEFNIRSSKPIIGLNKAGEVVQIDYSNLIRDRAQNIPLEQVIPLFHAMKEWDDRLWHKDNCVSYKLKPGEIVCFDNQRVLHGRQGYQLAGGERKLIGAYIDWDEMRSGRRVLRDRLGSKH